VERFQVPLGDSPSRGASAAKVTIVEFADFECPYCARVADTLERVLELYPEDVQVVYKHQPLPFHERAVDAALAAEAARERALFWQMHDRLFANQRALGSDDLLAQAAAIGLDPIRFEHSRQDPAVRARLTADQALAKRLAVQGTPSFFINGRPLVGARPLEQLTKIIDEEIGRANELIGAGIRREAIYAELTRNAPATRVAAAPTESTREERRFVAAGDSPSQGPEDAPVTIVEFCDLACPFCARAQATLERVMSEYQGRVRLVWKDLPLPIHSQAIPAALAARAAGEQGRFWEMQRRLFADRAELGPERFERHALALGLDVERFRLALARGAGQAQLEADRTLSSKLDLGGTPTFFINGERLVGAQPYERFKERIERALEQASGPTQEGVAPGRVYETLTAEEPARGSEGCTR
jgi:protein-disulfide isomerase